MTESEIPDDLRARGLDLWKKALADGTPAAGDLIAEALLSERKAEREKAAVVMKWQSATKAPRDGRALLFCSDSELMFARWELNPWTNQMCFSSADFSIPTSRLDAWIFIDGIPDPRQFDDKDQQAAEG